MAMSVGSVTINADGSYSASDAAKAIMDALDVQFPPPSSVAPAGIDQSLWTNTIRPSILVGTRQFNAKISIGIAALITYVQTNADVRIPNTSAADGLQTLPAIIIEGTPTTHPTVAVTIPHPIL
jgi:hypothetical protein